MFYEFGGSAVVAAIGLPENNLAAGRVKNYAGCGDLRADVDNAGESSPLAPDSSDFLRVIDAVLQRENHGRIADQRRESFCRCFGVVRLDTEEH